MKFVKSSLLVKLVILILVVYATVTLVRLRSQISEKEAEAAGLTSSIASTQQENDRLQSSIDALDTPEGLERSRATNSAWYQRVRSSLKMSVTKQNGGPG